MGACSSLKQKIFGRFFKDIDGCLQLMKTQSAIASGSAVLHALLPDAPWEPSDLDLYVGGHTFSKSIDWLLEWSDFLQGEGYEVEDHPDGGGYHGMKVRAEGYFSFLCC